MGAIQWHVVVACIIGCLIYDLILVVIGWVRGR